MSSQEARRLDEAAEWMLRLRGDGASHETITSWVQWCESDPRNQQSFDKVQELWRLSQGLAPEVNDGELTIAPTPSPRRKPGPSSGKWLGSIAAGVVLVVAVSSWLIFVPVRNHTVIASQEPLHVARLPDGSHVELAAKSTVAVRYTAAARVLELEGGEAYFSVVPDRRKPFVVKAGRVRVRAVGTAFNVRRAGERVVVTVTEGAVDVERLGMTTRTRVRAGTQVAIEEQLQLLPQVTSVDSATALAWREGRLEYTGEPLEAVVADINRYARRPVVIGDNAAKRLRFSGTVLIGYVDEWMQALPTEFPVRVSRQNGVDVIQTAP